MAEHHVRRQEACFRWSTYDNENYHFLNNPKKLERLASQIWQRVNDSKSGPTRWATELGITNVDGQDVRLVVTRFEVHDEKKHGAGRQHDG